MANGFCQQDYLMGWDKFGPTGGGVFCGVRARTFGQDFGQEIKDLGQGSRSKSCNSGNEHPMAADSGLDLVRLVSCGSGGGLAFVGVFASVGLSQMTRCFFQWSLRLVGALVILGYSVYFSPGVQAAHDEWSTQFEREIYPLLLRGGEGSCLACHDESTSSELQFVGDVRDDFQMLLAGGYFLPDRPDSLLSRIEANNPKRRMPKGDDAPAWTDTDRERLRR